MRRRFLQRHDGGRPAAVVYCVCAIYLYCLGSLVAWASLPVLTGLTPTLIISDSMAPTIKTGDVVMIGEPGGEPIEPGNVVTFTDPANPSRLLTHRVVGVNPDGTFRTRGDANAHPDSTKVAPDLVSGVGRVLVPAVGVPLMWIRTQAWLTLLLWVGGTAMALRYLRLYGHRLPLVSRWSTPLDLAAAKRRSSREEHQSEMPVRGRRSVSMAGTAAIAVLGLLAAVVPQVSTSQAAFTENAQNADNQWAAATSFCTLSGSQTLTPAADTEIRSDGTVSAGTNPALSVRSKNRADIRSLLHFDLPDAKSCTVTAKLRLNLSAANTARVLQVFNAPAAWSEGSATWAAMPEPAATPVTNATPAVGWIEIPVTDHVAAMYSGTNNGFLLKDQTESSGGNNSNTQTFASRNAADSALWPQLVLTFGATAAKPPAPNGLTATALSASRIALAWNDTATDETSYTVQRSPGGATNWTTVGTLAADTTGHTDTGLSSDTSYDYRVRSTNAQGDSAWSNIASATTEATPTAPAAPSDLTAISTALNSVDLSWTDNATNEDGFDVEYSTAGTATWTAGGTAGPDVTSFSVTGLSAETTYDFRVRATNNGGSSDWATLSDVSTGDCSTAPTQTLAANADTSVASGIYAAIDVGTQSPGTFLVRSAADFDARAVIRFNDVTAIAGCSMTAVMRLNSTGPAAGRSLNVLRLDDTWDETTITWNTLPPATGTPVPATSVIGGVEWTVTDHVVAQVNGSNYGFVIQDADETQATAVFDHNFSQQNAADPLVHPQLVVTFQ